MPAKEISFSDLGKELLDLVKEVADKEVRKTSINVARNLIEQTPVDTSKALSNWSASLSSPNDGEREPFFSGFHGSTGKESSLVASAVAELFIKTSSRKAGQKFYISNNLDYIRGLDSGLNSRKNPNFVEKAIRMALEEG